MNAMRRPHPFIITHFAIYRGTIKPLDYRRKITSKLVILAAERKVDARQSRVCSWLENDISRVKPTNMGGKKDRREDVRMAT